MLKIFFLFYPNPYFDQFPFGSVSILVIIAFKFKLVWIGWMFLDSVNLIACLGIGRRWITSSTSVHSKMEESIQKKQGQLDVPDYRRNSPWDEAPNSGNDVEQSPNRHVTKFHFGHEWELGMKSLVDIQNIEKN